MHRVCFLSVLSRFKNNDSEEWNLTPVAPRERTNRTRQCVMKPCSRASRVKKIACGECLAKVGRCSVAAIVGVRRELIAFVLLRRYYTYYAMTLNTRVFFCELMRVTNTINGPNFYCWAKAVCDLRFLTFDRNSLLTCVTSYRGGLARPSDYTFLLSSLLVSVRGYPSIS